MRLEDDKRTEERRGEEAGKREEGVRKLKQALEGEMRESEQQRMQQRADGGVEQQLLLEESGRRVRAEQHSMRETWRRDGSTHCVTAT